MEIFKECRKYGIKIYQCPSFLFFLMGILIILSSIFSYVLGLKIVDNPLIVALFVLILSAFLLILAFFIVNSFENLARANRLKVEFINIASHQLQTPLASFRWILDLLFSYGKENFLPNQREYLELLKLESDKMRDLIKDLLTVSKIESERLFLPTEKISLEKIVKNSISEFHFQIQEKKLQIELRIKEKIPEILANFQGIKTVIDNLLDNAIKFSKEGGKIEIEIWQEKKKVFFKIKDEGIGIPKEDQKFIFEKFFRAKNALRYQTTGTGLGLFIVKNIIERSGGKIFFSSTEGKGTTFWFYLPAKK